jgi:hypothetical protein
MAKRAKKQKTGPKEQRLKLKGDWQTLFGKALQKKRPAGGWPKPHGGKE